MQRDFPFLHVVAYEMMTDFNVFGLCVLDWILSDLNGTGVVTIDGSVGELQPIIKHLVLNP